MGNQEVFPQSYHNFGFQSPLKITLDKDIYTQEETITGIVWLDLISPIILSDIKLTLSISEKWTYCQSEDSVYSESNEVSMYSYLLNIRSVFNIQTFDMQLAPGNYKFPFAIVLNKDIHPIFEYSIANKRASVRCSITVETVSNFVKFTNQTNIVIKAKPLILNNNLKFSSCVNVRSWSLFNQGTVLFTASYPTNNYKIGDEVPLEITVNNTRSKISTHSIVVSIIRKLQFRKKSGIKVFNFSSTISEKKFPIVVPAHNTQELMLKMPIEDNQSKDFNHKDFVNPYPTVNDITIFTPTIHCTTLKCEYEMKVTLYFEKFVTESYLPKVIMPIAITHYTNDEYMLSKQENTGLQEELLMNQVNNAENNNNGQRMEFSEDTSAPDAMFDYHQGNNDLHQSVPIMNYQNVDESNQHDHRLAQSVMVDLNCHNMQMS